MRQILTETLPSSRGRSRRRDDIGDERHLVIGEAEFASDIGPGRDRRSKLAKDLVQSQSLDPVPGGGFPHEIEARLRIALVDCQRMLGLLGRWVQVEGGRQSPSRPCRAGRRGGRSARGRRDIDRRSPLGDSYCPREIRLAGGREWARAFMKPVLPDTIRDNEADTAPGDPARECDMIEIDLLDGELAGHLG